MSPSDVRSCDAVSQRPQPWATLHQSPGDVTGAWWTITSIQIRWIDQLALILSIKIVFVSIRACTSRSLWGYYGNSRFGYRKLMFAFVLPSISTSANDDQWSGHVISDRQFFPWTGIGFWYILLSGWLIVDCWLFDCHVHATVKQRTLTILWQTWGRHHPTVGFK